MTFDPLAVIIILVGFADLASTVFFYRLWRRLTPSPLAMGLFAKAVIVDLGSSGLMLLALRRLAGAPPWPQGLYVLVASLLLLMGAKPILAIYLSRLE